jgi:hypothetical protein
MNPRGSVDVRALLGVIVIVAIGCLFLFYPLGLHWLRDHKLFDGLAIIAGLAFHLWNTYASRWPPLVR